MPPQKSAHMLEAAYTHCQALVDSHYENFPVASLLLPRKLRRPVAVIYAFARTADDIADEGDIADEERLLRLKAYDDALDGLERGEAMDDPIFLALGDVLQNFKLPIGLFHDLIAAFRMDVTVHRYATFDDLLHYCRHSANPVGRLLLHLKGLATPTHLQWSDAICTSLQLINFLQDLSQDYHEMERIYLPVDEMAAAGVLEADIAQAHNTPQIRQLIQQQIERTRALMLSGAPLTHSVGGRFGFELRLTALGGLKVLERIEQSANPFSRPRLNKADWLQLFLKALFFYPKAKRPAN